MTRQEKITVCRTWQVSNWGSLRLTGTYRQAISFIHKLKSWGVGDLLLKPIEL